LVSRAASVRFLAGAGDDRDDTGGADSAGAGTVGGAAGFEGLLERINELYAVERLVPGPGAAFYDHSWLETRINCGAARDETRYGRPNGGGAWQFRLGRRKILYEHEHVARARKAPMEELLVLVEELQALHMNAKSAGP
ncbi:hypothetical protein HK405_016061, partial [Cladochytrium tenue]